MVDLREFWEKQAFLRAEMDQLKAKVWAFMEYQGVDWSEGLSQTARLLSESPDPFVRTLGHLAEIGYLHLCESAEGVAEKTD